MCDQGNFMEFERNEEEDSNSDYGSLPPISSPGTLRWMEYVRSQIVQGQIERPIDFDSPNYRDMSSSFIPQFSFPDFNDDYRILDSQGLDISLVPIPVPASPTNYMETWSSFSTHVSFPEFSADCRFLILRGMEIVLTIGGANLSAGQNVILERLTPHGRLLKMFQREKHDVQLSKKLRTALPGLQVVLSDAENKQASNPSERQWLNELQDAVDGAENFIEEVNYEVLRLKVEGQHQCLAETSNQQKRQYSLSTIVQSSSHGRQMLPDSVPTFEHSKNASRKSLEVIAHTQTNNQHKRKKSTTTWSEYGPISLPDLERLYGKKREEAAGILKVSVSTFKRICRDHGIPRWPSAQRNREKPVISAQNVPLQVADEEQASTPQSPNAFPSALPPFSSSSTAIETHPESSPCPSLSKHREGNPSHDHNMRGNNETTEENDMSQGRVLAEESRQSKARNGSLSVESLIPDALVKTSQPPQNGIACEDSETSSMSRQKRRSLEKETDCMNEVTRFEDQPSEIQNGNPKTQATGFAGKGSSCLGSITGSIEGNKGYNRNSKSITGYGIVDDMDSACTGVQIIVDHDMDSTCMGVQPKDDTSSTRMEVQPPLESISTLPLNSFSCSESTAQNIKLHFDNLIALPLKDLTDPESESSMMKALSILADNLSLFSEEQAEQILALSFDFPGLTNSWREYSQSQICSQKSSAETDEIRDLVETSKNDEENLKVRFEELKIKEKELMAQLEAVQKEKASIVEQMHEKCKKTKYLVSLAEEKVASRTKDKHMMKLATTKLNNLVDQWARIQSFFM